MLIAGALPQSKAVKPNWTSSHFVLRHPQLKKKKKCSFLLNMTFSKQKKKINEKNGIDIFENLLKSGLIDDG